MDTPSVLLVIEPYAPSPPGLTRALMLTRYLHARLDILIYPQLSIPARSPAQAHQWREEEAEYLTALRQSIVAPDVEIAFDLAGRGSLNDAIVDKARQTHYALIIKAPWHRKRSGGSPDDWQLMRRCSVPLLLTAGKPWHPKARFLATIDVTNSHSLEQHKTVLEAANALKIACAAELDLVEMEPTNSFEPAQRRVAVQSQLENAGELYELATSRLHQLTGRTSECLRQFVAEREYDLLVVGMSNGRGTLWAPSIGFTLAQGLSSTDCDLLVVPDSDDMQPVLSGRRLLRWNPFPFWQWLGTD